MIHDFEKLVLAEKMNAQHFNPKAPVAQKVADEVVFRRFQDEGVEFFLIVPH